MQNVAWSTSRSDRRSTVSKSKSTSFRANGSGWELGIGRIGSIVGPLLGALFVGVPVDRLYMWSALPFAAGAVVCYAIHVLNTRRLAERPELRAAQ